MSTHNKSWYVFIAIYKKTVNFIMLSWDIISCNLAILYKIFTHSGRIWKCILLLIFSPSRDCVVPKNYSKTHTHTHVHTHICVRALRIVVFGFRFSSTNSMCKLLMRKKKKTNENNKCLRIKIQTGYNFMLTRPRYPEGSDL